jgi:predicted phage terminase large subunit-like protein
VVTAAATFALSKAQRAFTESRALYRGFVGGRGAGKSFIATYDLIRRAKPTRLYLVTAPTFPVLRDSTLRSFVQNCNLLGVPFTLNKVELRATLTDRGAEVVFRSADNPELLRGPNLSGAVIDEASLTERATFDILIACLREAGEAGWLTAAFTPRGKRNWTFETFGTGRPDTELFRSKTSDNPFLPPQFEAAVRRQYTTLYATQELGGEFIDAEGTVFAVGAIKVVDSPPTRASRCRYWDKASVQGGDDYTAGVLMSRDPDGVYAIEDVQRGQWSAMERNRVIRDTAARDLAWYGDLGRVQVWLEMEPGSGGKESAELSVRELAGHDVHVERVTGEKLTRWRPLAAQVEAGNVHMVRAAWNRELLDELAACPDGPNDDQADAAAGAFAKLAAVPTGGAVPQTVEFPKPGDEWHHPGSNSFPDDWAASAGLFGMGR